jgi:hypothetical protein
MTPEERIARLETRADGQDSWLKSIDEKVDKLVVLASTGQGALRMFLKVGSALIAAFGICIAIYDRIHK